MPSLINMPCRWYSFPGSPRSTDIKVGSRVIIGNFYHKPGVVVEVIVEPDRFRTGTYRVARSNGKRTVHSASNLRKWESFYEDFLFTIDKVEEAKASLIRIETKMEE